MKREARELMTTIATKFNFEPTKIFQMINVNQLGLNIKVDDDVVRELPEGQDMTVEFARIPAPHPRSEWYEAVDGISGSEELTGTQGVFKSEGYLLKLIF
jgi:hypothetical protein